jgi:hypothetical protein
MIIFHHYLQIIKLRTDGIYYKIMIEILQAKYYKRMFNKVRINHNYQTDTLNQISEL